jgi:hypothetical protein
MTLIQTIEHFIEDQEGHLECLSWDIREETNYDDEIHKDAMEELCDMYDTTKERIENLKKIKSILENLK